LPNTFWFLGSGAVRGGRRGREEEEGEGGEEEEREGEQGRRRQRRQERRKEKVNQNKIVIKQRREKKITREKKLREKNAEPTKQLLYRIYIETCDCLPILLRYAKYTTI